MQIKTLEEALTAVAAYHGGFKTALSSEKADKKSSRTALEASTHARNYVLLAEAYGIASALLAVPEVLAQLLNSYSITAARKGQNEFGPIVRALFRTATKHGTKPNKSAWKFGNILRLMRDKGWKQEDIATELDRFTWTDPSSQRVHTKLKAAELADRDKYKEVDEEKVETDKALKWFLNGKDLGTITAPSFHEIDPKSDSGDLISLAASWDGDRKEWVIRGLISTNNDMVLRSLSSLRKGAVEAFEEHSKDLFKRLAVHNTVIGMLEEELRPVDQQLVQEVRNDPRYMEVPLPPKLSRSRSKSTVEA